MFPFYHRAEYLKDIKSSEPWYRCGVIFGIVCDVLQ